MNDVVWKVEMVKVRLKDNRWRNILRFILGGDMVFLER